MPSVRLSQRGIFYAKLVDYINQPSSTNLQLGLHSEINELKMSENCPTKLYNWLHENLEEGHPNDYVDLLEIKRKLSVEVTSRSIGNFIKKMFIHVNVKNGRGMVD